MKVKKLLNKQQLEAVESIEGPVMVLAGPGTGKTQVVAVRIAEILQNTQISPRNILALTFTEAGVTALRSRLESIIGPDAYQVTIATFHGFANEIIGTFPYLFNFDDKAAQIAELDRFMLLEKIVSELPDIKLLRPLKVPMTHIKAIGDSIKTCKQEAISPDDLRKLSKKQIADVNKQEKNSKAEKEKIINFSEKNIELADIYEKYQEDLTKTQRYDYEDMILLVVDATQNNEELRLHYQERYQYILVDEYQDTNNGQNSLVEVLASFFENPNLFVVGDDKQAIFRFQGASVANMLHFVKKFPDIKIVSLKDNYRSCPEILSTAGELIKNNTHQICAYLDGVNGDLSAVTDSCGKPQQVNLPTKLSQYGWIIDEIKKLTKAGATLENIAVLFRVNNDVREFRSLAEKSGLMVSGALTSNLIFEPEIQLLITILHAIDKPLYDMYTIPTLRALSDAPELIDLLEIMHTKKRGEKLIPELLKSQNRALAATAANQIISLHKTAQKSSLTELFEIIIDSTTILDQVRLRPNHLEGLEFISAFLDEAKRFSMRRPAAKLNDFLEYLELLNRYNIQIPINRVLPEREGVFVSTVHGAKGLEFETVFMPNTDEKNWNERKSRSVIKLPSAIVDLRDWNDDPAEDDRRVFYVGLTRAKKNLYLTMSDTNGDGKELLPCRFISEISETLDKKVVKVTAAQAEKQYQKVLTPVPSSAIAKRELEYICERVKNIPFSYSALKTYKQCPKQYLLKYIFNLPTEPTIPLVYGSAVHRALELFFRAFKAKKYLPNKNELLDYFRLALNQQPYVEQKEGVLSQGLLVLSAYYDLNKEKWQIPVEVESLLTGHKIMLGDAWLTGKFDRVDVIDPQTKSVRLVDYKTVSKLPSMNEIVGNTKNSDGDYKTQLVFYSLLTELDPLFPYRATEFSLDFIGDKLEFKTETLLVSREEREELKKEIEIVFKEILERKSFPHTRDEFDHGCEVCAAFPSL